MPAILTTPGEIDTWIEAPAEDALQLQRPLADRALVIVATGEKKDEGGPAAQSAAPMLYVRLGKRPRKKAGPQYLLREGVPAKGSPS